jgi:MinD-like ATPase involved in chromosome partitioning or flagellar assembly
VDVPGKLLVIPKGQLFLIPSSIRVDEISRVLREGYDVHLLNEGMRDLIEKLALDVLLIDTHPGLNEETLMSIAIADSLVIIMRPDQQDYQGTGVTIDLARELDIPHMMLIINQVPQVFNFADVKAHIEHIYDCEVAAVLPHSHEMLSFASSGVFVQHYPDHPITQALREVTRKLLQASPSG